MVLFRLHSSTRNFYEKVLKKMYLICRLCFTDEGYVEPIFKIEKSLVETIKNILPFEVRIYYFDYTFVLKKIVFL